MNCCWHYDLASGFGSKLSSTTLRLNMILVLIGIAFVLLGLFSGAILVAAPFGWVALQPRLSIWFLFPAFSILGLSLVIVGAKTAQIRRLSLAVSSILLLLAVASAFGLVLAGASIAGTASSTSSLWFVLVVAGMLGTVGVAAYSRTGNAAHESV
jgi:hypothetical protein